MTTTTQQFIVRSDRAGVFFGEIESREGSEVTMKNARRVHYWQGAASLSQMAVDGIGSGSRVTMPVDSITILGVIEIIPCTEKAAKNLSEYPVWKV